MNQPRYAGKLESSKGISYMPSDITMAFTASRRVVDGPSDGVTFEESRKMDASMCALQE